MTAEVAFLGNNNVPVLTVALATYTCAYKGEHSILYFKWVDYIVCELCSMKLLKMITFLGSKLRKIILSKRENPFCACYTFRHYA